MTMKVYGYPNTRSLRVVWALEEAGLDYEYCCVNLMQGEARSKAFTVKNAAGKLPVLELDGEYISESAALVNLIAAQTPKAQLIPLGNGLERARYDQWSQFAVCELEQPIWTMTKHKFALPESVRCTEIFKTAAWEYQQALALLSKGLGAQEYILGNVFTGADILLGHSLFGESYSSKRLRSLIYEITWHDYAVAKPLASLLLASKRRSKRLGIKC